MSDDHAGFVELIRRLNRVPRETPRREKADLEAEDRWLHPGQAEAMEAETEVVLVLAGRQSGKTVTGPRWLLREIQRKGPGDYAIVGPTLELLKKKALPEFLKYFQRDHNLGTYNKSDRIFHFSADGLMFTFGSDAEPCSIFVGYATKPDSLESATYKAVWADEAGQTDFKQSSWEALEGRRAVHNGRILLTTTPYAFNWLKSDLYDKWLGSVGVNSDGASPSLVESSLGGLDRGPSTPELSLRLGASAQDDGFVHAGGQGLEAPETHRLEADATKSGGSARDWITVVRFESWMNPEFARPKFDAIRGRLPTWKFDLFYRAIFSRPAGAIFDCFDKDIHTTPRRLIPRDWLRFQGVDFGNVNTASNWAAMDPVTGIVYVYRTYHDGSKSALEHVKDWDGLEELFFERPPGVFDRVVPLKLAVCHGGAPSEDDWRDEFAACGLPISRPPFADVETGIGRIYSLLKSGRLKIFDDLTKLVGEIEAYSRKVNEAGEPLAEIEDKHSFHRVDALRYLCAGVSLDVDDGKPLLVSRSVSVEASEVHREPEEEVRLSPLQFKRESRRVERRVRK